MKNIDPVALADEMRRCLMDQEKYLSPERSDLLQQVVGAGGDATGYLYGGLTTAVGAQDGNTPTIIIEEMRHDLGKQYERKVFRHKFKVKNTGKADLMIEKVKPG